MVKLPGPRPRSAVLSLEALEERLSPAVVTEAYPGAQYNNGYGDPRSGLHVEQAPYYLTSTDTQKQVALRAIASRSSDGQMTCIPEIEIFSLFFSNASNCRERT